MRKTKIICTLGPALDDPAILKRIFLTGMDVARLNFSHGTHEEHLVRINLFKQIRAELGRSAALLLDTKGPEIRLKKFRNGKIMLPTGSKFILTTEDIEGDETRVSVTYKEITKDLAKGNRVLIDDGLIDLKVTSVTDTEVICEVINGGELSDKKGVNLQGVTARMPFMSDQDRRDLLFGIENDFEFVAASFVRNADDVK